MSCHCHPRLVDRDDGEPDVVVPDPHWRTARVTLVQGNRSAVIRPSILPAHHVDGVLTVRLDALWRAAQLPGDLLELSFDFMGRDGYRPTRHGYPPLAGILLASGNLELETRRLAWDLAEDFLCAYRVWGLTMIIAVQGP
jgi:hypothetical protein